MVKLKFLVVTVFVFLLILAGASKAIAGSAWEEAGLGVASVLSSAIYSPIKVHYAALGAVAGGVAWAVTGGNAELAQKIWEPALRGDYVITPKMLRGNQSSSRP